MLSAKLENICILTSLSYVARDMHKNPAETLNFIQMQTVTGERRRQEKEQTLRPSSWLSARPADIMYRRRRLAVIMADTEGRRRLNQSRLEQVVISGRITCERSFCPLIERRWRVRIRNGYWSTVTLSASTLMTRQCNLTWSKKVQRCWWVFRVLYSYLYSLHHLNFVILHQSHSVSCLFHNNNQ